MNLLLSFLLPLSIILSFFLILPQNLLLSVHGWVSVKLAMRNELVRGQNLLRWLDSLGLGEVGFNLKTSLPDRHTFRHYGETIHGLWEQVRSQGGQLRPLLQIVRKELRNELLRVKKEREYLKGAVGQVVMMILLVYIYLFVFARVIETPFPRIFWWGLPLFQLFGVGIFLVLLRGIRKRNFGGLRPLSSCLLEMRLLSFQGNLGRFSLPEREKNLGPSFSQLQERMEQTLEDWKRDSRVNLSSLDELEEDLDFLREIAGERFMSQLKIIGFLWSMLFVLPILFGASLFGLYELTVV